MSRFVRWHCILLLCWILIPASLASAQHTDATQWTSGLVNLNTGWLEHDGDDLRWAQPNLDDQSWQKVELDNLGAAEIGWKWYRIHIKLAPGHDRVHLLVSAGAGTYELYINGVRQEGSAIRSFWDQSRPTEQVFIPRDEDSDLTIAVRMHVTRVSTVWHLPPFLTVDIGTPGAIENKRASMESDRIYSLIPSIAINFIIVLAGLGAFALFRAQPSHPEYRWLALFLVFLGIANGLLYSSGAGVLQLSWNNFLADPLIYVYTLMQIEFTFSFAGRRVSRVWRVYEAIILASLLLNPLLNLGLIPSNSYITIEGVVIFPAALLLPIALFVWYRKGNREAGLLIVPTLMPAASTAAFSIGSASLFAGWGKLDFLANPIPVGPVSLQVSDLGDFLFVLAIAVVMFFRFTRVSREQARTAAELQAAREIQQRLVPQNLPHIPGYAIEAAYLPALEVGGDFYQVFHQNHGTQLVVVGDVSGKGLKAAMTGMLAIGAFQSFASEGLNPAAVLTRMNRRLSAAQDGGFITCICAQITNAGSVVIANAGHIPPYLNGEDLAVPSDLPLGIAEGESYEERTFQLQPGDRLTLISDGVLEARDSRGALFGFERTRSISQQSAQEIAAAACTYGQEDDITVLALTWTVESSPAPIQSLAASA